MIGYSEGSGPLNPNEAGHHSEGSGPLIRMKWATIPNEVGRVTPVSIGSSECVVRDSTRHFFHRLPGGLFFAFDFTNCEELCQLTEY
ncbi:MAG: hypothetical protein F4Z62_09995 [Rhodothermaceae bacterium]|nr:hypothetical protein [Rhodothermaceae bacterium]MYE64058.1 hypothetical protein [Rhodothermaceae bacterium]